MPEPITGVITAFQRCRSYGFIVPDGRTKGRGHDHFFHVSDVDGGLSALHPGRRVQFTSSREARGLRARSVCPLEHTP